MLRTTMALTKRKPDLFISILLKFWPLVILVHNIMSESWKWEEAWCFQKLQTQDHNQNNQKGDLDKAKLDIFL